MAAESFRNALAIEPGYVDALAYLGLCLDQIGQDGLPMLAEALRLQPSHAIAHLFTGMHYLQRGSAQQALDALSQANRFDPENPTILAQMARAESMMGHTEQALALYQATAESAPQTPTFWVLLAQFSLSQEVRVAEVALPAARKALMLDPNNAAALDALGYGHFMLNHLELAERLLLQAIASDPTAPSAHYHLGLYWSERQDVKQASIAFHTAIKLDPEGIYAELARRAMKEIDG